MLVRCPDCTTKYEIAASLIPENGVKVRCPKCKAVFAVSKDSGESNGRRTDSKPSPDPRPADTPIAGKIQPRAQAWVESPGESPVVAMPQTRAAVDEAPKPKKKITDPRVAERLARAVIQEVLYGRDQERHRALEQGRALSAFGDAIADAFDVYRERVSPDLPGATETFRSAVNGILGEGRELL